MQQSRRRANSAGLERARDLDERGGDVRLNRHHGPDQPHDLVHLWKVRALLGLESVSSERSAS